MLLLASGGEGIICVLMALPFAIVMALVGAALGQLIVSFGGPPRPLPMLTVVLLLYPAAQEYEARNPASVEPQRVTTQLTVEALPAAVRAALLQPVDYPAATGWFRTGVVYPTRTAFALDSATGRRTLVCRYSQGLARLPVVGWYLRLWPENLAARRVSRPGRRSGSSAAPRRRSGAGRIRAAPPRLATGSRAALPGLAHADSKLAATGRQRPRRIGTLCQCGADLPALRRALGQAGFEQVRQQRLWPGYAVLVTAAGNETHCQ